MLQLGWKVDMLKSCQTECWELLRGRSHPSLSSRWGLFWTRWVKREFTKHIAGICEFHHEFCVHDTPLQSFAIRKSCFAEVSMGDDPALILELEVEVRFVAVQWMIIRVRSLSLTLRSSVNCSKECFQARVEPAFTDAQCCQSRPSNQCAA